MSRAKLLFLISVLALIGFIIEAISGFILWLVLPHGNHNRGSTNGTESTFIWVRQTWTDIHDWAAVALLVIIAVHIYLHWHWLYRQAKKIFKLK